MSGKGEYLHIRIASEVKEIAEAKADALGMTLSEYVRFLLLEAARKEGT
ncbi:hypothetical protein FACS1894196_3610 [Clostridia bacterium]|nr:hypothetical protein FACS1894196_3610 [Clostridia bacterium]